jgi:dolichyl-diphosphooligosaccharide--protein glycosyltransferase
MRGRLRQLSIYGASLLLFAALWSQTAATYVPEPSISSKSISAIVRLKQRLPESSVVLSWWDYGYALAGLGGFATYHDGSFHRVNTYLIARALSSTSQEELYGTVAFMSDTGEDRLLEMLANNPEAAELLEGAGRSGGSVARDDIYILMLGAMTQKYAAIHYLGNWDLRDGSSRAEGYQRLECSAWAGDSIDCGEMTIDTKTGYIREDLSLEKLILIRDGRLLQELTYPNKTGVYLQVLLDGASAYGFLLLNERVLQSNFNRMFFLGRFDQTLYEEAYNDFPTARLFRLKKRVSTSSPQ